MENRLSLLFLSLGATIAVAAGWAVGEPQLAAEGIASSDEPAERRGTRPTGDVGIFSELDDRVVVKTPSWIDAAPTFVLVTSDKRRIFMRDDVPIGFAEADHGPDVAAESLDDADGDGIPDQLDVLIGAKKTVLNNAKYEGGYYTIEYPNGDVPRDIGVCTDVIVRAFRNAGLDIQKLLYEDIGRRPKAFPFVKKRNRNIDHRRVKTLLPYFQHHYESRHTDVGRTLDDWLPGDVVFMDTLPKPGPDHIGIISDTLGPSGYPLVINNWTNGYRTSEMDLLDAIPITHRFRLRRTFRVERSHQGLAGLLGRSGLDVAEDTKQLVVVTTPGWNSPRGELVRMARSKSGGPWRRVGKPVRVSIGSAGLGWGRGEHGLPRAGRAKVEGDRRAPAGVFLLGTAFGKKKPRRLAWPWRQVQANDRFVDDPNSPHYNTWQNAPGEFESAERMTMYRLGVVVQHNMNPVKPGAGSAIFLHTGDFAEPTVGCTGIPEPALTKLIAWFETDARPMLVQVPGVLLSGR